MKDFKPTAYTLQCVATERTFEDTGWVLEDKECQEPSLVRAIYDKKELELKGEDYGFYTFCDWLPISRLLKGSAAPVT
jgi:cysteate synthase